MTYCVGLRLNAGLVFLSDSRTNAGLDQISSYRKMIVYEKPGDRFMVLLSAGNLSISQSVREILQVEKLDNGTLPPITIWNATSMFDAVRVLGSAVRRVHDQDGPSLKAAGIDFNASMIFGGQIEGEAMRLFLVYSAGNFIEATRETSYFQVGESKYGKPILDRVITPATQPGRGGQVRAGVDGLDAEVQPVGRPAARPAGLPGGSAAERPDRLHRRAEPLLPHDPRQLGPEAARGLREHRGPAVERRRLRRTRCARAIETHEPMRKITHPGEKIV